MRKAFTIAFCAMVVLMAGVMDNIEATPGRSSPCSNCHDLDSAVTVTISLVRCSGSDAEYEVSVSNTYSGGEGWAIFDGGSNIRNGYGNGTFTVPGDVSFDAWGVSDGSGLGGSDRVTIGPDCAGPTCTDDDSDGYFAESDCGTQVDCDDGDMAINPGAAEDCTDGIDNDCDGLIDADDPDAVDCPPGCTDADSDGYFARSDGRRVGEECGSRWSPHH